MIAKKRFKSWKWVLLLVLLGAAFAGWRWYEKQSKESPIDYKTVAATRGDLTQVVTANGQINAVKSVAVGSQVSGIITDIKVDFNSRVTNGQVVAQIDPSTYQQNIMQSEADLTNAAAGLELAVLNERRAKALSTSHLIPDADYDAAVVALHQAQAIVKMRDAALRKTQVDLERTTIYAPIDGIVISRVVDIGQTVAASFNAPVLFTIANDLHQMRIEAMVSEADVGGVEEGQQVSFTVDAFPGRKFRGEVTQVRYAPVTNQNVVSYTAVVEVNNADLKLRPGMTANASIIIAEKHNALRIPSAALRFRPPEGAVVKGVTNAPGGGTNTTALAASDSFQGRGDSGESREERRKRFESMTPEQREQMRARFAAQRGGAGGQRNATEGPMTRTIYVIDKESSAARNAGATTPAGLLPQLSATRKENPTLKPVTIKTGISDGTYTEVLEGLNEGDLVVTGVNLPASAANTMRPPGGGSPFGGPFGGGGGRGPR